MTIDYLTIAKGLGIIISGVAFTRFWIIKGWRKFKEYDQVKGKTFIITGANSGIGKVLVEQIYRMGGNVIMIGKDEVSLLKAIEDIKARNRRYPQIGKIFFKQMNLNSFKSIEFAASEIKRNFSKVNVIINNAGVMRSPFFVTEDGFENHMSVNHLGHALFTTLLIPILSKSGTLSNPSRVVFVTSSLARRGTIREIDFQPHAITKESFDIKTAYSNSKLAALLYAKELSEKFKHIPIVINMASPGMVYTSLGRHFHIPYWKMLLLAPFAALFLKTPTQGSQTVLYAAASAKTKNSNGKYFRDCIEEPLFSLAMDIQLSQSVYQMTTKAISRT